MAVAVSFHHRLVCSIRKEKVQIYLFQQLLHEKIGVDSVTELSVLSLKVMFCYLLFCYCNIFTQ